MLRPLAIAALLFVLPQDAAVHDGRSALQIQVAVMGSDGKPVPVARHGLLISDEPPTAPPRRIQTTLEGTATVRLRPGRYMVESEKPVAFEGRTYEWIQVATVAPGRDATLSLTAENAEVATATSSTASSSTVLEGDPSSLLSRWGDSVVVVWTPTARASGFLVDARGVILTNQRAVGAASSVEVQLTSTIKVAAGVVTADAVRDVAVLRIDPGIVAGVTPVPLGCAAKGTAAVKERQEIYAIEAPIRGPKSLSAAMVDAIAGRVIDADFALGTGGAGGPVFTAGGHVVGITSLVDADADRRGDDSQVVRIEDVCATVVSAEPKLNDVAAPAPTQLPIEPDRAFPIAAIKQAASGRTSASVESYRLSSSAYDITFITPALMYASQNQPKETPVRGARDARSAPDPRTIDPLDHFSNWSAYVVDFPPVVMVRVTPKLVEGFWMRVARGAMQTQGASLPPIKRFKPGFARLQAFCGKTEVVPIHPFKIEQRVSDSDAMYEGLYVFDPGAFGPQCGSVKLVLYSEKEPQKGDTRVVEPKVVQQVWEDFAPYRN